MERFKLKVAVYVFLIKDEKILLLRRFNTGWNDGNYGLPAGHLESNETVTDALLRESFEEVGVKIQRENIQLVHTMHRMHGGYIDLFFMATEWENEPVNNELDKCDEVKWFDLNHLPPNMVPSVKMAIESYMRGELFSEIKIDA